MSFRFWKRIKVAPGVTLNLSKSGGSVSIGPPGAKFTIGPKGKRATVGIPGTGLYYTKTLSEKGRGRRSSAGRSAAARSERLTPGFFERLMMSDGEEAFVDGCRQLVSGNDEAAYEHMKKAVHIPDAAYLAGFLALKKKRLDEAVEHLTAAAGNHSRLNRYFTKYGITATMSLRITDEIFVHVGPNLRGVLLGLVEAYQRQERLQDALSHLERLQRLEPEDVVVKLSLAELLWESHPGDRNVCRKIMRLSEGIANDTEVHTALLLYRGRALRGLGLLDGARQTLTDALRRRKNRSAELMQALRYERALVYEALGQARRARSEFERIYAEDPDYEDVAVRLGVA